MAFFYQSVTRNLPDGYSFRGATLNDVPVVISLFSIRQVSFQAEELRREWHSQNFNPAMDVRLIFDQREQLIGYIEVWTMLNEDRQPWLWGCVHPAYEGHGVGTALLRWAEARVCLYMDALPEQLRVAPRFGAPRGQPQAQNLCLNLGWQPMKTQDKLEQASGYERLTQSKELLAAGDYDIYEKEIRAGQAQLLPETYENEKGI